MKPNIEVTDTIRSISWAAFECGVRMSLDTCPAFLVQRIIVPEDAHLADATLFLRKIESSKADIIKLARAIRDELNSLDLQDEAEA